MSVPARQTAPALLQIGAVMVRLSGRQALAEVGRYLRSEFPQYGWIGFYRLDGHELVLAAYDGERETEHTRIPIGLGVCGRAVRENRTVLVGDVSKDPEYLSCFLETRSEIVVPVHSAGAIVGEIDVDAVALNAFDASDQRFLESVGEKIAPALLVGDGPRLL